MEGWKGHFTRYTSHIIFYISRIRYYAFFSIAICSIIAIFIAMSYFTPIRPTAEPAYFEIASGATAKSIATQLRSEKLIRSPFIFQLVVRLSGASRELKAGTYQLSQAMSLVNIIDYLRSGNVVLRRFVVPEGFTLAQIGQLWEDEGSGETEAFNRVARDVRWREMYNISGNTLEGYLFQNTYRFADGTPVDKVIEMMLDEFDRQWTHELHEEAESLGFSTHEILTLASIIEKEAKADDERSFISAVYHNRLQLRWRLEADPTVIYVLGDSHRLLTTADLKIDSPYNTYLHRGIPPGPICNPGLASILAALRPAETSDLFFVAIGDGRHHFSRTFTEHQRMIRKLNGAKSRHVN